MNPAYVVTDVEVDGPVPGENSMLSFASVAVDSQGQVLDEFAAVLSLLENAVPDPETMAWFQTVPEAFAAATENPRPPADVMQQYVDWVRSLKGDPIFAAHPLAMDGSWIDYYLRHFTGIRLLKGPWAGERLFYSGGFCLRSYAAGVLRRPLWTCNPEDYPAEVLGGHQHSHRAIDDARGYAHLLSYLLEQR